MQAGPVEGVVGRQHVPDVSNETTWDKSDPVGAPGTDEPPPRPNLLKRLWMVLFRPRELFQALAANPEWFRMALFAALVAAVGMAVLPANTFFDGDPGGVLSEQDVALLRDMSATIMWSSAVITMVLGLGAPVILSSVSYVIFVFMRGARAAFKQHLCVMSHAGIITAIGSLVAAPTRIATGNPSATLALGDLTPFLDGYLYNVLSRLDLFALWATVVAGLGLLVIDPRRRWGPPAAALVPIYVVMVLVGVPILPPGLPFRPLP